ncbi:hypothetical protein PTKIN_Ptkin14bG0010400 [Pterospermum kingtungense]
MTIFTNIRGQSAPFVISSLHDLVLLAGNGTTILEAIILASAATITLTIYALCGSVGGFHFSLCPPCLLCTFLVVCLYVSIQILHGYENLSTSIYGFLAALLFCGHTYIAGNQIVQQHDIQEAPFSAVVYGYWTFLYYLKPSLIK